MTTISRELSNRTPAMRLAYMLQAGAEITRSSKTPSNMLNGIKYYYVEVTMNQSSFCIQAYGEEAIELYAATIHFLLQTVKDLKHLNDELE